jgi:hypothetical protein
VAARGEKNPPPKYLRGLVGISVLLFGVQDESNETNEELLRGWRNLKPRDNPVRS